MSEYPTATVTLEDLSTDSRVGRPTIDVTLEADPYGISLILPGGEEFYLEYYSGRFWLRHYKSQNDQNPETLINVEVI